MPYKRCQQCKKRISEKSIENFCGNNCKQIYTNSDNKFCKHCNTLLGKSSVIKTQYCNNRCHNAHQKKSNLVERKCIVCNNIFQVTKSSKRYKLCSVECEKKYISSDVRNDMRMDSLIKTNLKKYGVKYSSQIPSFSEKVKKTKLEKYGDENYNNIEKIKNTKLIRYGNEFYVNTKKSISTKLDRYGKLHFNDESNKTKLEKYGTLDFSKKANDTKLKKYGTLDFSKKANDTIKKRYGSMSNILKKASYNKLKEKYKNFIFLFSENEYDGSIGYLKYNFQCKNCNNTFEDTMANGSSPRCPICFPYANHGQSSTEKEILEFIKNNYKNKVLENDRSILDGKELDIYIPDLKIAIEYDGLYWHSELNGGKDKNYHLNKTLECESKGIRLIHIFENEWLNKQEIVKSKIQHLLKINKIGISARKCYIKEISSKISNQFLEKYHIQGKDKSKIRLGLYHKDELVAVMSFSKQRIALGIKNNCNNNNYELIRFCTGDKNVIGAGGRLLSYFIKNYSPDKIITYADRRYSNSTAFYDKIGFKFIKSTTPGYWYFNKSNTLHHRFNFRKNVLSKKLQNYDANLSEWQNMQLNGYDRIWDCGHLKYEWTRK